MVHLGLDYSRDDKLLPSSMAVLLKHHWVPSNQLLAIHTELSWLWDGKPLYLMSFSVICQFEN